MGKPTKSGRAQQAVTKCQNCPLRNSENYRAFSDDEFTFMEGFKSGELTVDEGAPILVEGHDATHVYTVLSGWTVRYKGLDDGRRQILNFGMPGDLVGLQSAMFDRMDHSVDALTEVRLCVFPRDRLWSLFEHHAGLAFDVTWLAAQEETIIARHLANVGQRSALQRLAYMIAYLFDRARRADLANSKTLHMPLTQEHIADAMGLSMVHTNKTLKRLRDEGLIDWQRNQLTLTDEAALLSLADYRPLHSSPRPFL